jgi:hypothetical protein
VSTEKKAGIGGESVIGRVSAMGEPPMGMDMGPIDFASKKSGIGL